MSSNEEIDKIFEDCVGGFGPWQFIILTIICICKLAQPFQQTAIIFLNAPMKVFCEDPLIMDPIETCNVDCKHYNYSSSLFESTVKSEWGLACAEEFWAGFTHTAFMFGNIFGNLFSGLVSDNYGRKKAFCSFFLLHTILAILCCFTYDFTRFLIYRFITGIGIGGIGASFVILIELISPAHRSVATALFMIPFPLGMIISSFTSYNYRAWRDYYLILSLSSIPFFLMSLYLPESPRFLLSKGKVDKCVKLMESGARTNGLPIAHIRSYIEKIPTKSEKKARVSLWDVLKHRQLRKRALIVSFIFFSCTFNSFGLLQYVGSLHEDIFLSIAMGGAMGLPCYVISYFCAQHMDRKKSLAIFIVFRIFALSAIALSGAGLLSVGFAIMALTGNYVVIAILFIYSSELSPTTMRHLTLGMAFACSNLGSALSPYPTLLTPISVRLPAVVFDSGTIFSLLLLLCVPETRGKPLPENIEDIDNT